MIKNENSAIHRRLIARLSQNDYTIVMNKQFFSSPVLHALTKWSTWLFILASILLHIFLLESSAWKDWAPKSVSNEIPHITVSLTPAVPDKEPATTPVETSKTVKASPAASTAISTTKAAPTKTDQEEAATQQVENPPEVATVATASETEATTMEMKDASSSTAAPEFTLRVPDSAEMQLEITNTKVNGNPTTGVGSMMWDSYAGKYKISIEAGINLLITTLNLLTITSEGFIDVYGLMPIISNDVRKTRAATTIHFNHQEKTISFSASNKVIAMENGAQDAASVLIQLAAIGYADATQLAVGKEFSIQVAEGRDATPFLFRVVGEEEIDSPINPETNKLLTVHITRPPKPGFYNSQLDIWLAPSVGWYPVQIRNTESNGTVTNQRVIALKQKLNLEK